MINTNKSPFLIVLAIFMAVLMGMFTVFYASLADGKFGILLALPALILIAAIFLYDRYLFFSIIIIFRSSMDLILDKTKVGGFGLGAVINALVILIAIIAIIKAPAPVRRLLKKTWIPFLLITFFSVFISPDFMAAIKLFLAFLSYAAIFLLAIILIKNQDDYGRWMRIILLSSVIPVIFGFVDIATGGFRSSNGFRINSTFSHPNIFAFYLVLMISISFYFIKSKVTYLPIYVRRTLPFYIFVLLGLLVMTKTRSAWISCFAFFILYALFYERKYLIYILLTPLIAFIFPEVGGRLLDLTQGNEVINYSKLNSYAWRKLIWQDGLSWMEPSHYFFGYGLDSFKYFSTDFFSLSSGEHHPAHSVYVQLLFETGIFGLLSFIWLLIKMIRLLLPYYKENKLLIFSSILFVTEFAVSSISDNMLDYLSFNWYLWFVVGAAYAVSQAKNTIKQDSSKQQTS